MCVFLAALGLCRGARALSLQSWAQQLAQAGMLPCNMWDLSSMTRIPTLESGFSTTGPTRKSQEISLACEPHREDWTRFEKL